MPDGYDVAIVCTNGHSINASSIRTPEFNAKFCDKCGAEGLSRCRNCQTEIRGWFWGVLSTQEYVPPLFCHECGKPFPWMQSALSAATELIDMSDAQESEKAQIKSDLP